MDLTAVGRCRHAVPFFRDRQQRALPQQDSGSEQRPQGWLTVDHLVEDLGAITFPVPTEEQEELRTSQLFFAQRALCCSLLKDTGAVPMMESPY